MPIMFTKFYLDDPITIAHRKSQGSETLFPCMHANENTPEQLSYKCTWLSPLVPFSLYHINYAPSKSPLLPP
jgi:hypothetical protein